jgi:hypothetical protein
MSFTGKPLLHWKKLSMYHLWICNWNEDHCVRGNCLFEIKSILQKL